MEMNDLKSAINEAIKSLLMSNPIDETQKERHKEVTRRLQRQYLELSDTPDYSKPPS